MVMITLINGDIIQAKVDAIVNAANPKMLGGGGVDGAIHRAAGSDLLKACQQVEAVDGVRCPSGQARITTAGKLRAKYVIHAVGPIYHQVANPEQILQSAYRESLKLALAHQCLSIALPAISCGVYGYPLQEAAEIALTVCTESEFAQLDIQFYLFGEEMMTIWQHVQTTLIQEQS
ncbi:O-acetyl-ADP-ribose deacetylase [Vibrio neptunius]|uniref:O-acetyl-ADP-ribose deacetylase n=1 Tax=Vibrio neptunius TaxID=170651 RepID=UPI00331572DC